MLRPWILGFGLSLVIGMGCGGRTSLDESDDLFDSPAQSSGSSGGTGTTGSSEPGRSTSTGMVSASGGSGGFGGYDPTGGASGSTPVGTAGYATTGGGYYGITGAGGGSYGSTVGGYGTTSGGYAGSYGSGGYGVGGYGAAGSSGVAGSGNDGAAGAGGASSLDPNLRLLLEQMGVYPTVACTACAVQTCGAFFPKCSASAACSNGVICSVSAGCVRGQRDIRCLQKCFAGDDAALAIGIASFSCVYTLCADTCKVR